MMIIKVNDVTIMDPELKKILDEIKLGVNHSVQSYKRTNEIKFIELSISELDKMIIRIKNSGREDLNDFLMILKGMRDELSDKVEDDKKLIKNGA